MIKPATGQQHATPSQQPPVIVTPETILASVREKVRLGNVDEAINETVTYIKLAAKAPQDKSRLQDYFNAKMGGVDARGNYYRFCDLLANSIELQQFMPDNTPPLFHPQSQVPLQARSDHRNTQLLQKYFNKTAFNEVVSLGFSSVSDAAKAAIRNIAVLSGKLFNSRGQPAGGCFRISSDLVIMPFHCARHVQDGTIQFLDSGLHTSRTCHVASILEVYENIDMAVVQLHEKQEKVDIRFNETVLDDERLFLLHYPDSSAGSDLQVSGNVCKLSTWDGYSLVTAHDSSPGSSGGIYINENGEIVGIHIGAHGQFEAMSGAEKYAFRFNGVIVNIDADSKIYDFLDLEGPKRMKQKDTLVPEITLDSSNTITPPSIDASQITPPATLLGTIASLLRGFYNSPASREFCCIRVNNVDCQLSSEETITVNFSIVVKASDKYLAGIEINTTNSDGSPSLPIKIGNRLFGYNQVVRIEYPHDEKKFGWINTHMFSAHILGDLVRTVSHDPSNSEQCQMCFDYFIQLLESAKIPVVEVLENKIVEFEQNNGTEMSDVISTPATYGSYSYLFAQAQFVLGRVKLNHSKLSKLFPNTRSCDDMIKALKLELDNTKSISEFVFDVIIPILVLLGNISSNDYDKLLTEKLQMAEDDLLALCLQHESTIRGLFTPVIK